MPTRLRLKAKRFRAGICYRYCNSGYCIGHKFDLSVKRLDEIKQDLLAKGVNSLALL
jgi:hypothetical protein